MAPPVYMLDTDTLVFVVRGSKANRGQSSHGNSARRIMDRVRAHLETGARVGVSAVTVSELEYGAARSARPEKERRAVTKILAPFELFDYDAVCVPRVYGRVRRQLSSQGTPIGSMDLMIAAHALALEATLVTNNTTEFARVEGLAIENWS